MPNRYLRESLKESESVNSVGFQAQVTWVHLVLTVDDWGRCEANPRLLRPKLFPLRLDQVREADLERWIAECERAGLVRLYRTEGKDYLQMMKWELGRAEKSRYPNPPEEVLSTCYLPTAANGRKQPRTAASNGKPPPTTAPDSDPDSDSDPPLSPPAVEFRSIAPVLYAALGIETPSMQEEGQAFEAWQELKAMKATAEEFAARAARYRKKWPDVAFTFRAVLKNWSQMAPPKAKAPVVPVVEYLPDSLQPEDARG